MGYTGEVADLYVILRAVTDPFKKAMAEAAVSGEETTNKLLGGIRNTSPVIMGVAAAATAAIGISIKWASDFETQYTRLYTAAGATKQSVLDARQAMLDLGTATGFTGTQIAEALYHPVSAGFKLADALNIVKASAEEARISGASLDDTTYSLSSVMKAFNFSGDQASKTMALLNAIVGEGDMRFQDFNASIKNWAPTAAMMGVSIQSMGAALAYLTDRGMKADEASTRVTMGLTMMAYPTKQASALLEGLGVSSSQVAASSSQMAEVLKKAGVTQNQLAADLKKPDGINVALSHLQDALKKAGVSGTEADAAISKIFGGGRSDKAILSLLQNLKGLQDKYDAIGKDSSAQKFEQNWVAAQKTAAVEFDKLKASIINLGIAFGEKLLPYVKEAMGWINTGIQFILKHREAMIALASVITGVLTLAFLKLADTLLMVAKGLVANPWGLLIMAIAAGAVEIITHWNAVKKFFEELFQWVMAHKDMIAIIVAAVAPELAIIGAVVYEIITHWKEIWAFLQKLGKDFAQWGKDVGGFFVKVWDGLTAIWRVQWDVIVAVVKAVWKGMKDAWTDTVHFFERIWNETGGKVVHRIAKDWGEVTAAVSKEWRHISDDLKSIWSSLVDIWNQTGGKLVTMMSEAMDYLVALFQANWGTIKAVFQYTWNIIWSVTKSVWDIIYGYLKAIWDVIRGLAKGVWDLIWGYIKFSWERIVGTVKAIGDILMGVMKAIWDVIEGIVKLVWDKITGIINTALDFIKDLFKVFADIVHGHWHQAWEDLKKLVSDAWHNILGIITSFVKDLWNIVYKAGKDIIMGIVHGIEDFLSSLVSGVKEIWQAIINFFKDVGHWLYQAGKDLIQGLINGITDMIGSATDAVSGLADSVWNSAKHGFGLWSPSHIAYEHGQMIVQGLINGIDSMNGKAVGSMNNLAMNVNGSYLTGIKSPSFGLGSTGLGAGSQGNINIYVQGSVLTDRDLRDVVQTEMLQLGARYSTSYTPYKR